MQYLFLVTLFNWKHTYFSFQFMPTDTFKCHILGLLTKNTVICLGLSIYLKHSSFIVNQTGSRQLSKFFFWQSADKNLNTPVLLTDGRFGFLCIAQCISPLDCYQHCCSTVSQQAPNRKQWSLSLPWSAASSLKHWFVKTINPSALRAKLLHTWTVFTVSLLRSQERMQTASKKARCRIH